MRTYVFIVNWKNSTGRTWRAETSNPRLFWNWIKSESHRINYVVVWNAKLTKFYGKYTGKGKRIK